MKAHPQELMAPISCTLDLATYRTPAQLFHTSQIKQTVAYGWNLQPADRSGVGALQLCPFIGSQTAVYPSEPAARWLMCAA